MKAGQTIIALSDSLTNYDLAIKQARNGITLQEANATTSLVNLDNQISSAQSQYDKAVLAYNQLNAGNDLKYDNVVQKNKDQLKTYNDAYRNYLVAIDGMATQYLYDADLILGMTSENQYRNNSFENYLGVANGVGRSKSEDEWNKTYAMRGEIRKLLDANKNFTDGDTNAQIETVSK